MSSAGDHNAPARARGRPYEFINKFNGLRIFLISPWRDFLPRRGGIACVREFEPTRRNLATAQIPPDVLATFEARFVVPFA